MMKYVVTALVAIVVSTSSLAKMTSTERVFLRQEQQKLNIRTQTKNVLAHALPKTQRKFVVTNNLTDEDSDLPGPDELDLQTAFRRPRIVDNISAPEDVELSDYISVRLMVARARALQKYNEKWANTVDI